jgi:hypothetical protein
MLSGSADDGDAPITLRDEFPEFPQAQGNGLARCDAS